MTGQIKLIIGKKVYDTKSFKDKTQRNKIIAQWKKDYDPYGFEFLVVIDPNVKGITTSILTDEQIDFVLNNYEYHSRHNGGKALARKYGLSVHGVYKALSVNNLKTPEIKTVLIKRGIMTEDMDVKYVGV